MTTTIAADTREQDNPPGWPRPVYIKDGRPKPVQWITDHASSQIMSCSADRTYAAGVLFACSCCASMMEFGFIYDAQWVADKRNKRFDEYDAHYGSPLCVRCAVFALKVCPHFADLDAQFGDELPWTEVLGAGDYKEFDESSALELTKRGKMRNQVTSGDLKDYMSAQVTGLSGVTLTDDIIAKFARPADQEYEDD